MPVNARTEKLSNTFHYLLIYNIYYKDSIIIEDYFCIYKTQCAHGPFRARVNMCKQAQTFCYKLWDFLVIRVSKLSGSMHTTLRR
jgi:hypothetical protein